jgi:dolichol-phosphate mannosyltransferase
VTDAPEVSVVLPVFNESAALRDTLPALLEVLRQIGKPFEIVCVDDGSVDDTADRLDRAARDDGRVVPVLLSRRFGKEAALAAGLEVARGRAVILMDADLQHPPSLLPMLLQRWEEGYEVVEAVRRTRGDEGAAHRAMARLFYGLIGRSIGRSFQGSTDFKLLDRQVVDALLLCRERNRFFRGLVAWVGFRVTQVPFDVPHRLAGRTKWSSLDLLAYSVRSLLAFTSLPLRIVAWSGLAMVMAGMALAVQTLYNYFSGHAVSGFTTVILVELILGGLILTSLGVLAFYIALIYDEQKARPLFVVRRPPRSSATGPTTPLPPRQ